jgi:hypothetical protein
MSITPLRPTLHVDDRACAAMRTLIGTVEQLEALRLEDPVSLEFFVMEIEKAEKDIALLRTRMWRRAEMKRSLVDLSGQFGRAP